MYLHISAYRDPISLQRQGIAVQRVSQVYTALRELQ